METNKKQQGEKQKRVDEEELQELVQTLPTAKSWSGISIYFYQGFWCPAIYLKGLISFQKHFQALEDDIILASFPKSGTTWLKSLIFSVVNRNRFALKDATSNPLLALGPHQVVPYLEMDLYSTNPCPDFEKSIPLRPRIFATHIPFASLPPSIKDSNCKTVYVCRNPLDTFISFWHFSHHMSSENIPLAEAFEMFCRGIHAYGPLCDHMSGYLKASQENPKKILILKYEDLKEDTVFHVKKLAEFLGFPFSEEEEKQEVMDEITKLCSFDNLKNMEVNKSGKRPSGVPFHAFYRKGQVGDWSNYLSPSMAERFEKLNQDKLLDMLSSGMAFNFVAKQMYNI